MGKSGSNVFALFSQRQIQEFKEAFGIMDADKDGLLSSSDLVAAFAGVGKSVSDGEAQGMLSEAPGPVNFTQMVMLFAKKTQKCSDTPSLLSVTNSQTPKSTTPTVNF